MTEKPLVSVIINCYNGEKYLREAIDSVIAQTYENWELVFWDNQSTDSTREIVESYKNPKIHYYYASEHTPLGEARNLAVEKANGEYINFLDADDVWSSNKLDEQVKLIVPGKVEVVYTPFEIIYGENTKPSKKMLRNYDRLISHTLYKGDIYTKILEENYIIFSGILFKKKIFIEVGGVNGSFQQYEDWDLLLKTALSTQFGVAKGAKTFYRIHGSNNTTKNGRSAVLEMRVILSSLPQSRAVERAIKRNETRYAYHFLFKEWKVLEGLKHIANYGTLHGFLIEALNKL